MPQNKKQPSEDQQPSKRHETDSAKIIHRHLENEKDIITDEDIRNIKIDTTIGTHDLNEVGAEAEAKFDDETDEDNTATTPFDAVK